MIANFYKMQYGNYRNSVLLVTRNIEHIPSVKTVVIYNGQKFCVDRLEFNLDKCECNIYMARL